MRNTVDTHITDIDFQLYDGAYQQCPPVTLVAIRDRLGSIHDGLLESDTQLQNIFEDVE